MDASHTVPEEELSLEQFIALPTTVSFHTMYSERFRNFVRDRPYIRIGTILENTYVIAYTNQNRLAQVLLDLGERFMDAFARMHTLLDTESLNASGITAVQQLSNLNLHGQGVLLGFIDTGIDYTKPAFIYEDGTSKIQAIWDQTNNGNPPAQMHFGTLYEQSQINQALRAQNSQSIVPHQDTQGHGTFLASIAGSRDKSPYEGVAADAELVVVKLKRASSYYIETTHAPADNPNIYASTDIMLAIQFILNQAALLQRPVAICIALGSNFGGHDGFSIPDDYLSLIANRQGVAICTAAGNEALAGHHVSGKIIDTGATEDIEVQVTGMAPSFSTYIWSDLWDTISVSITSPSGEVVRNIPFQTNSTYTKELVLEKSTVSVGYFQLNSYLTNVTVVQPTVGIWRITVHGDRIISGNFDAWLPITGMISPNVVFLRQDPDCTIVEPATSIGVITCGAYNSKTNSLYASSSRGPTRLPRIAPDFVAPGVDVMGLYPSGYGTMSGTSVASSIVTGAAALFLQWGIVDGHEKEMDCNRIRALLIAGCNRIENTTYPNNSWGYGMINLLNSFRSIP